MAAPAMRTLRVSLVDLEITPAGPGGTFSGEVWAKLSRQVRTTDGQVVVLAGARKVVDSTGIVDFSVPCNDDTGIHVDDRGFGVTIGWDLTSRGARGSMVNIFNVGTSVMVSSADPTITQFALKAPAVPAPTIQMVVGPTGPAGSVGATGPAGPYGGTAVADTAIAAILATPASATARSVSSTYARSALVNVVFDGDSLTAGSGATSGLNYVNDTANGLDARAVVSNTGIGGQTMAQMVSTATDVDSKLLAGKLNVCSAFGGTNDLFYGASAATAYASIQAYHAARKAAGWDKTIAYTITPRSDAGTPGGFEAARQSLNALIVAGWASFADALVDIGNDSVMGLAGATTGPLYADLVHPSNAGHAVIAGYVRKAFGVLGVIGAHDHTRYVQSSTIFIPPDLMHPYGGTTPTLTNNHVIPGWAFATAAIKNVTFAATIPADWTTMTIDILWANNGAGAGGVYWTTFYSPVIVGTAMTNGASVSQVSTAGAQDVPVLLPWNTATPPLTVASTQMGFMVQRWGGQTGDTLANDALLLGVILRKAT